MAKFLKDFDYNTPTLSGEFTKGQEAPAGYPEIIAAATAAGALPKKGETYGLDNDNAAGGTLHLKG